MMFFSKNSYKWLILMLLIIVIIGTIVLNNMKDSANNTNTEPFTDIEVNGRNAVRYSLHSVNFIDENTGWMVKDEYNPNSPGSQILSTVDGGETWKSTKINDMMIIQLKFINKSTGWAIAQVKNTSEFTDKTSIIRILHTEDGGNNWITQWENKMNLSPGLDLHFQDETNGYSLINGQLLATQDGGANWSQVILGVNDFIPQHMSFANVNDGWVIGVIEKRDSSEPSDPNFKYELIVLQTNDGGRHWQQQFKRSYREGDGPIGSIDINFVNKTTGWFLTSNMNTWTGDLYYTSDGGLNWQPINQIGSVRPSPMELDFVTPEIGWIPLDVGAGPVDAGLLFTHDAGKHFDLINNDGSMYSMHEVDFTSVKHGWGLGTNLHQGDYLVHTTDGGKTWTQVYPDLRPTDDIAFVDNQHGFGLGQLSNQSALLYTEDAGHTWKQKYDFSDKYRTAKLSFYDSKNGWVLATLKGGSNKVLILKTTDGGDTWETLDIPEVEPWSTDFFKFFDADHGMMVTTKVNQIYRTEDGGKTWKESVQERLNGRYQYFFVSNNEGWLTHTTFDQSTYAVDLSQLKKDESTWESLGRVGSNTYSYGIYFISKDKGWMIVEESPFQGTFKLVVTYDGGKTWSSHQFPEGFRLNLQGNNVPVQFTDEKHGWILSMRDGLLSTNDGGRTWTWNQ